MGVTMLRLEGKRVKWRIKMMQAFEQKGHCAHHRLRRGSERDAQDQGRALGVAVAPLITVLREGIEAVVFVGGVSLGQSADSIPIAAICVISQVCFVDG